MTMPSLVQSAPSADAAPFAYPFRRFLPPRTFSFPISNTATASMPPTLRAAMEAAFGASDAAGAWDWKLAYDACEAATVLFLRKYGKALLRKAGSPARALPHAGEDRRSPADPHAPLRGKPGLPAILDADPARPAAAHRRAITPADRVLEPSAGTGLLAILAEIAGGTLCPQRAGRDPRRSARLPLSGHLRSPASTRPRSTIIWTPRSCPASS